MPQYIVARYYKRELYIASANLTNLDLSKIVGYVTSHTYNGCMNSGEFLLATYNFCIL